MQIPLAHTLIIFIMCRLSWAFWTFLHPRCWFFSEAVGKCTQWGNLTTVNSLLNCLCLLPSSILSSLILSKCVAVRVVKTADFLKPVNSAKKDWLTITYLKVLVTRCDTNIVYAGLRIPLRIAVASRRGQTAGSQKQLTSPCCGRCRMQLAWRSRWSCLMP